MPELANANCFFRTLTHIIFGDESEHHNVCISKLNTFDKVIMFLLSNNPRTYKLSEVELHMGNCK